MASSTSATAAPPVLDAVTIDEAGGFALVSPNGNGHNKPLLPEMTPGFEAWWELWSKVRGNDRMEQAVAAWISVMTRFLVNPCMECTRSYLNSLNTPSIGYNPENFLYRQAKQRFSVRWPAFKRKEEWSDVGDLARKRWDEEGRL